MSYPCPGIRVVRGSDWSGKDQDGGEGHVGTVVKIQDSISAKGKVTVIWDSGREFQYNAGLHDKFDLLVFDSGPTGVAQKGFTCDGCGENPIVGIRWKCAVCTDFDLCSLCYNTERHDLDHAFLRCITNNSPIVRVPPRSGSRRIRAIGLFKEAKVMRGPHWKYGNQDGHEGNIGEVVKLGSWTGGYARGAVNVRWSGGSDSLKGYRSGSQGLVELITVDEAPGWRYYKDHLPVLDVLQPDGIRLKIGDKVKAQVDASIFERLHRDITGYKDSMEQCLQDVGTVVKLADDRDERVVVVQYPDAETYVLVKSSLTRLHSFVVGDTVKIIQNYNAAVELQNGHGGWNDKMENCLGKEGKVSEIDKDGDLRVNIGTNKWYFSPVSCDPQDRQTVESNRSSSSSISLGASTGSTSSSGSDVDDIAEGVAKVLLDILKPGQSTLFKPGQTTSGPVKCEDLLKAVSDGDIDVVREMLPKLGNKINDSIEGLTPLQMACYKGHFEIAELLIAAKADLNKPDNEGDTPLHYAVSGDEPELVEALLMANAEGNRKNKKGFTPLHLTIAKRSPNLECLNRLLKFKCDPNTQDADGDTPLHDAIRKEDQAVLDAFVKCPNLNLKLNNSEGNNPFHEACSKMDGDTEFPQALIKRDPGIVNVPTKHSLTPLHIAAFNGFVGLAGILIKAKCNVNALDANGKTSLHLAVQKCNLQLVQLLLESGAEINCRDSEGNTPLHCAHMNMTLPGAEEGKDEDSALEIRCHLAEHGGDISIMNNAGKTPMDFVKNKEVRVMIERIAKRPRGGTLTTSRRFPAHWEPMGKDGFAEVELSPENPLSAFEYRHVESLMEKTLSNKSIERVHRIQNVALWEQYDVAKRNMEREYGKGLANEQSLFHGTTPESAKIIPHQNIDFRLAGKRVGTRYGQGAYFAVDAKYSDGYSKEDKQRHKFLFLAKVLVGKTRQGNSSLKRPPLLDKSNQTKLADSACDNENSPSVYVIFSENQIYPEYLIEYS